MAEQNRTTLKGYFNTGDKPTEAQFADFIDSAYNKINEPGLGGGGNGTGSWDAVVDNVIDLEAELVLGSRRIFLKNGTYTPLISHAAYSGLTLVGESKEGVIIDGTTNDLLTFSSTYKIDLDTLNVAVNEGDYTINSSTFDIVVGTPITVGDTVWFGDANGDYCQRRVVATTYNTTITVNLPLPFDTTITDVEVRDVVIGLHDITIENMTTTNGDIYPKHTTGVNMRNICSGVSGRVYIWKCMDVNMRDITYIVDGSVGIYTISGGFLKIS